MTHPALRTLERGSLSVRLAASIRAAIINGEYELGQKLREVDLSQTFGASNTVIREALLILQGEGLVVNDPYRGRSVFTLREGEASGVILTRALLESLAAYLAAANLDQRSSEQITAVERQMRDLGTRNFAEWVEKELLFHRTIWEIAGNTVLYKQLNQLVLITFSLNTVHYFRPQFDFDDVLKWEQSDAFHGHERLAKAILSGNPPVARKAMILHILRPPIYDNLRRQFFEGE